MRTKKTIAFTLKAAPCASQPDFMPPSLDDTLTVGLTEGPLVFQSLPTIRFSTPETPWSASVVNYYNIISYNCKF